MLPEEITCSNCGALLELEKRERQQKEFICPACDKLVDLTSNFDSKISPEIKNLEALTPKWADHVDVTLSELKTSIRIIESRLPESKIISPNFWARAWTVFGYQLVISVFVWAIYLLLNNF